MELRAELQFPSLDESKVQRLTHLADTIDGARQGEWEDELAEFNRLAGTSLELSEFQGISGCMEPESWVRNVLCEQFAEYKLDLAHEEMIEIISRLCSAAGEEHEQYFWIKLLERNLDPRISDLIYRPGEYFGDGDNSREMSPQEILDVALTSKDRAIGLPDKRSR